MIKLNAKITISVSTKQNEMIALDVLTLLAPHFRRFHFFALASHC